MLKHATINRTAKAQQSLKLQQQLFDQRSSNGAQQKQPASGLDEPDGGTTGAHLPHDNALITMTPTSTTPPSLCNSPSPSFLSSCSGSTNRSLCSPTRNDDLAKAMQTTASAPASLLGSPSKSSSALSRSYSGIGNGLSTTDNVIKVYAQSLSQDVEYVTLRIDQETNCKQIIRSLLRKFCLKHRDPNLYYLTLERWIRKDGLRIKSVMLLGDDGCPLQLQKCCSNPPHNDIKFTLQNRTGTLVRVYCSDIAPNTRYKCLSLSPQTTVNETIELMLHCLNLIPIRPRQSNSTSTLTASVIDCCNDNTSQRGIEVMTQTRNNETDPIKYDERTQAIDQARELANHSTNSNSSIETNSSSSSASTSAAVQAVLSSNDTSSTSSGIESESAPMVNTASNSLIRQIHTEKSETCPRLDADSLRANSILSISSASDDLTSLCDEYCILFEGAVDGNFKSQVLDPHECIVDIFLSASNSTQVNEVSTASNGRREQSIKFILRKRNRNVSNDPPLVPQALARQNMPLPALPMAANRIQPTQSNALIAQQLVQTIVSTTQIEVNAPRRDIYHAQSQSVIAPQANGFDGFRSGSCRLGSNMGAGSRNNAIDCNNNGSPVARTNGTLLPSATSHVAITVANAQSERLPPPPKFLYLAPPIRPRRRNLSNASSTFGRSSDNSIIRKASLNAVSMRNSITANRRRYSPAQLADDLNKLDVTDSNQCDVDESVVEKNEPVPHTDSANAIESVAYQRAAT